MKKAVHLVLGMSMFFLYSSTAFAVSHETYNDLIQTYNALADQVNVAILFFVIFGLILSVLIYFYLLSHRRFRKNNQRLAELRQETIVAIQQLRLDNEAPATVHEGGAVNDIPVVSSPGNPVSYVDPLPPSSNTDCPAARRVTVHRVSPKKQPDADVEFYYPPGKE